MCGYRHKNSASTPVFGNQLIFRQFLFHPFHIGAGLINLINCHDNFHSCRFCMADSLHGLRHNTVVCSHHENGNIRCIGSAHTHCSKCFMARCIQKCNLFSVTLYHISADVLSDASCFPVDDMSIPDRIQQRSFSMIHMSHYTHNRRTFFLNGHIFFLFFQQFCYHIYFFFLLTDTVEFQRNFLCRCKINFTVDHYNISL